MRIVLQGDSITDAGRDRADDGVKGLGEGYPLFIATKLYRDYPGKIEVLNRGISGDRVCDVYSRIKRDGWALKPDILSIFVGVNDVWHKWSEAGDNSISNDKYYEIYDMLIRHTLKEMPKVKIVIVGPAILKNKRLAEYYDEFRSEVQLRAESARKIAEKYDLTFVELQKPLDEAAKTVDDECYWLRDGVHPAQAGRQLIAEKWIETVTKAGLLDELRG